ncbi:DUF2244 domain-containing protein [Falsiroseomonas sp.]|uniref:DUF2244 domain-containing protein n=1 Tax=Falsiroseomonas sp. TaxID=2870721 RepID=UPI00356751A5
MMSGGSEAILFEAVTAPPAGLSARGMRWLCGLVVGVTTVPAVLFAALGAWPVLGFLGGEVLVVLGMVATHRRWSRAAFEAVRLTEARLLVTRADGRGGQEHAELEPYWARLDLAERPGAVPVLTARARGRSVEIGRFLPPDDKRALASALEEALRRYRMPIFDNPQLREG